jgi:ATP-dependent DNA helicase RecG
LAATTTGAVVGVENAIRLLVDIPNKARDILGIMVDVSLFEEDGKEFVQIAVEAYPNPIRSSSSRIRIFWRSCIS